MLRRILGHRDSRLRLTQSLGAFTLPDREDISPLYVFLDIANEGNENVEIDRIQVLPRDGPVAHDEPLEGERNLPTTLEPGGRVRFWIRAKLLARNLREAGYTGRPRLRLVVEDGAGNLHEKRFTFRADEYLRLKDE